MEHRAGWDATFSAPKSVSLTALVGGDARVREAHEASVDVALHELQRYAQARLGGNRPSETTGNWAAAKFAHDSSRPVDGYAAPQVHTHVVIFNMTRTADGEVRPLQPRELYKTQQYATAVYRSELATRLTTLGYQIERGATGQPEIAGYSAAYLEASSPRRRQIEDRLEQLGQQGAAASQIAAHQTRESKADLSHDTVQRQHREMAARFGEQPARVIRSARVHDPRQDRDLSPSAHAAVTFAKDRNIERAAVVDERALLRDALSRSMGNRTVGQIRTAFEHRAGGGDLIQVPQPLGIPARQFTTPEMTALERENIARMRSGQSQGTPLAAAALRRDVADHYSHLSTHQRAAVEQVLSNTDQVQALEGVAGSGKTTVLGAVRDAAERGGLSR